MEIKMGKNVWKKGSAFEFRRFGRFESVSRAIVQSADWIKDKAETVAETRIRNGDKKFR